jgi:hypothetical protein
VQPTPVRSSRISPRLRRVPIRVLLLVLAFGTARAAGLAVTNGLSLWLSADTGTTLAAGAAVTAWTDRSGAGHSASQGSVGAAPTLAAAQLNGLPVLHFAGGQFLAVAGQPIHSQQFTILAVARDQRSDSNYRELISNWNDGNGNTGSSVFFGTTGSNPVRARFSDDFGGAAQGQSGVGTVAKPAEFSILSAVNAADGVAVYQNIATIATRGTPLSTRNLIAPYSIGRQGNGTFDEYWRGDIAEMLVYDRALDPSELLRVWQYLQLKYLPAAAVPLLTIERSGSNARVGFAMSQPFPYRLQSHDVLAPGGWSTAAYFPAPTTVSNVLIDYPATKPQRFFRLSIGP